MIGIIRLIPAFSAWVFGAAAIILAVSASVNSQTSSRVLNIKTEPGSIVWLDDLNFGRTDKNGILRIENVSAGTHRLRVRADGFAESVKLLNRSQNGDVAVVLRKTDDPAELAFQEAERMAFVDREKAAASYRKAIALRPRFIQAYMGLARTLSEAGDPEGASKAIRDLRKISPRNAEASAIEGRIQKDNGEERKAIAAFKRSIAEGKGIQPEAYTGLGLLYKEKAEGSGGQGDLENETANYSEATRNLTTALKQLGSAPDAVVLYQLVGLVYERQKKYPEAIAIYREFLRLFPTSNDAPAVNSFIEQLQKRMDDHQ